jgi:hypothetical protein
MSKHLLLGSALLLSLTMYPQHGKLVKPSGTSQIPDRKKEYSEPAQHMSTPGTGPVKGKQTTSTIGAKTTVVTAFRFTGSMNVNGLIVPQSEPLQYNAGVNAVTFVHRKSATYVASSNSNSGSIVTMVSTNPCSNVWDSTCVWSNGTNLARYPQGGIYNPLGNTNLNNAYFAATGPCTWSGTPPWVGSFAASKQLNMGSNNVPGADQQFFANTSPFGGLSGKVDFPRYSFSTVDGGFVRSLALRVNDISGTTAGPNGFGFRGASMMKGQFNAGTFIWSVDSFIPPTTFNSAGTKNCYSTPVMAWAEDGVTGYVVFVGSRGSETVTPTTVNVKGGYQPIVYKTTNSGASWGLLPANDFTQPQFRGLTDRLYPLQSNSTTVMPNMTYFEDYDAVVDANNQLHFVTTAFGHSHNHVDSLGYRYTFNPTEVFSWDFSGSWGYPTIYDFYTTPAGWDMVVVDSMGTMGPGGTSTDPGYNTNVWADGMGAKMDLSARIQVGRSTDGQKIFYSWSESDTAIIGTKWNIGPNIKVKGYDVMASKLTPRMDMSSSISNPGLLSGGAFWHYMSNEVISASGNYDVPLTITTNQLYDGSVPVDHYYICGATLPGSSFTVTPLYTPTSVKENAKQESINVNLYPNPASDHATVLVNLKEGQAIDLSLYTLVGQEVRHISVNGTSGENKVELNLENLSKGVYFYSVKVNGTVSSNKLIIE